MHGLIPPFINFSIFVGLLVYFLRKPILQFVKNRSHTMASEMKDVRKQLEEAKGIFQEGQTKMSNLESEAASIQESARSESEALKKRISQVADGLAKNIVSDAQMASSRLSADLIRDLRGVATIQIFEKAEKLLRERVTGDDQQRISRELTTQLERMS